MSTHDFIVSLLVIAGIGVVMGYAWHFGAVQTNQHLYELRCAEEAQ